MTTEIYYFSGTGNSYSVASNIAKELDASLLPVIPYKEDESISSTADVVGIVFPIYDFKAPQIVNDFLHKLKTPDSTYFFGVCTYGVAPLNAMKKLEKVLDSEGRELSAGFTIKLPHSGLGFKRIPAEERERMLRSAEEKCETIAEYVRVRRKGENETSNFNDKIFLLGPLLKMLPRLFPMLKQALFHGWDSLGFYSDEDCNSCGVCEKVCPMNNIVIKDGKPSWGDNCMSCFACLHWCPEESVQIANLTGNMERRHHPEVNLCNILEQKEHPECG